MNPSDFLNLTNLLPEPMLLLQHDGLILAANSRAARLLGIPPLPEQTWFWKVVRDPEEKAHEFVRLAARRGELGPGRLTLRTATGEAYPASCRGARLSAQGGNNILVRIEPVTAATHHFLELNSRISRLHQEISRRKQVEEELLQINEELIRTRDLALEASRAKSEFLANMSHELRTPLNAIIGYAEMLTEILAERGDDAVVSDLQKIHASGQHLLGLIGNILDVARIEAGHLDFRCESFRLGKVIEDAVGIAAPLMERNGNTIEWHCDPDVGVVWSDPTRVRQILFNLLSNAAKFTRQGAVTLLCSRAGNRVKIAVTDTGVGMDSRHFDRIFEKFYQVDSTSTRRYGGSGLGLAITKLLCECLGGQISVQSKAGTGTSFTVELPVDARPYVNRRVPAPELQCDENTFITRGMDEPEL